MTTLAAAMAERPVVLDGGLATQLESQGHDLSSAFWSARLLAENPRAVTDAHRRVLRCGCRGGDHGVLPGVLRRFRGDRDRPRRSGDADAAQRRGGSGCGRRDIRRPRWVAASVGPYGAALADGSEYRGDYGLTVAELRAWHRPRLAVLADAGADVLACETIPCLAEAEALLAELAGSGVPCWLSMTAVGDRTRAGEPLAEAFAMAAEVTEVIAVGVNCVDPGHGLRAGPDRCRQREAGRGLPQQRRGLGRRRAPLGWSVADRCEPARPAGSRPGPGSSAAAAGSPPAMIKQAVQSEGRMTQSGSERIAELTSSGDPPRARVVRPSCGLAVGNADGGACAPRGCVDHHRHPQNRMVLFRSALAGTRLRTRPGWNGRRGRSSTSRRAPRCWRRVSRPRVSTCGRLAGSTPRTFAAAGGSFPVRVRGVGVVAAVTVSGLTSDEDHEFVVESLESYLREEDSSAEDR